jgi:hypothetical protein
MHVLAHGNFRSVPFEGKLENAINLPDSPGNQEDIHGCHVFPFRTVWAFQMSVWVLKLTLMHMLALAPNITSGSVRFLYPLVCNHLNFVSSCEHRSQHFHSEWSFVVVIREAG